MLYLCAVISSGHWSAMLLMNSSAKDAFNNNHTFCPHIPCSYTSDITHSLTLTVANANASKFHQIEDESHTCVEHYTFLWSSIFT